MADMKKWIPIVLMLMTALAVFVYRTIDKPFFITDAESLVITSGSSGESIVVTDAGDIGHITNIICDMSYSKGGKDDSDGWSYSLKWLDKDGNTIEALALSGDGSTVIRDGYYYKVKGTGYAVIDLEFIASMFDGGN